MLELSAYGCRDLVPSSRRLQREAGRHLELIQLLQRLTPDFPGLSARTGKITPDIRREEGTAVRHICRQPDLFGADLVAIPKEGRNGLDGSRFEAQDANRRNFTRVDQADPEVKGSPDTPNAERLREKIEAMTRKVLREAGFRCRMDSVETNRRPRRNAGAAAPDAASYCTTTSTARGPSLPCSMENSTC